MSSAAESEVGAIFFTSKELVSMRQTLIEMGWPHLPMPIQTGNYMAAGLANYTNIVLKTKSTDLLLHWLRCREAQQQYSFYWAP